MTDEASDAVRAQMDDGRFTAAVALIGRTGATEFNIRYCDEDKPVVWMALARWDKHWEVGAALTPLDAVFRLCEEVIDDGRCQHCQRPTGFSPELDTLPLDKLVCWYQWDPSHKEFRRGCK
jgi:hypothetical protein